MGTPAAARWHRGLVSAIPIPGLPAQSYHCGNHEDHRSTEGHERLCRAAQQRYADDRED